MPDATALAQAITDGRTTSRSVMAATISVCQARTDLGAVARLLPDALSRADAASAGPFHGVPMLAKDLGSAAKGLCPAAGSPAIRAALADPDSHSPFFDRLAGAGAVPIGLSAVPEMGFALTTQPKDAGPARNPFDPAKTPGGSSGGAAAAVAGGLIALAHATDAAGSIRVPAACCGLWGLKPSRGATPMGPDFGNHLMGITGEGVLARSLRDVRAAFDATQGKAQGPYAPPRPVSFNARPRIALCVPESCDQTNGTAARTIADLLAQAGCDITQTPAPNALGQACHDAAGTVLKLAMAEGLDALDLGPEDVSPLIAATAALGRAIPGPAVFALDRTIAQLSHHAWVLFDTYDALVMPILATSPPAADASDFAATDPDAHLAQMEAFAPNIAIANICGLPALAIPLSTDTPLPTAVQLIGPIGSDAALLDLASRITPPPIAYPAAIPGLPA